MSHCKVYVASNYGIRYYNISGVKNKGFMLKTTGVFDTIILVTTMMEKIYNYEMYI